jgi:hypothetical protein
MREALESLTSDEIGLAVIDRSVVDPDSASWETAWNRRRRKAALIAIALGQHDNELLRFIPAPARVVLGAPYELPQIWRALQNAIGAQV